ncbi:MAG: electron transport complex subunit E [Clostridia bacterium]|nr:electron transport complex subunit E [Clostridia bacterium]
MNKLKVFTAGLIEQNPVLFQLLGMCSTLAVTTTVVNGIGMGLSTTAVLVMSNLLISLLRKLVPQKIRIASYIVIIAGFVTIVDMILKAYVPSISKSLGIFIPLIVVNCIILARAEMFASKNGIFPSILDGLGMGFGFTLALVIISAVREILGNGTFLGISLFGANYEPVIMAIMPPGAFIILGIIIAVVNIIAKGGKKDA